MGYNIHAGHCNITHPGASSLCVADVVNGALLTLICTVGLLLNVMIIAVSKHVHFPGKQKYFILNLAVADCLLALAGIQRGLGLISPHLLLGGPRSSAFCVTFALLLNFVGYINSCALIPITIERFVAIVTPFKVRRVLCKRNCLLICLIVWMPNISGLIFETASYLSNRHGSLQIRYSPAYGRCTYEAPFSDLYVFSKGILCFVLPLLIILTCYGVIFAIMAQRGIRTKRVLAISIVIIATGVFAWLPTVVVHFSGIKITKTLSHVVTIIFYYSVAFLDPLIFIFGYKTLRGFLRGPSYYRALRRSQISGMSVGEMRACERIAVLQKRSCKSHHGSERTRHGSGCSNSSFGGSSIMCRLHQITE